MKFWRVKAALVVSAQNCRRLVSQRSGLSCRRRRDRIVHNGGACGKDWNAQLRKHEI